MKRRKGKKKGEEEKNKGNEKGEPNHNEDGSSW